MGLKCIDDLLNRAFFRLGMIIGKHPGYFIVIPILLTMFFVTGYQRIKYNIDPEYLFSPVNGEGKLERAITEQYFKVNYSSRFNVARITRAGRFGRVIVTAKDGNKNILRTEVWKELRLLDGLIQNATVFYDDDYYTYKDICAKWIADCFHNDILNLDYVLEDYEKGELNLTFPLMFNPVTWEAHAFPVFFGGSVIDEDNLIVSVPSVQLVYFMNADTKKFDAKGAAWEDTFLDVIGEAQDKGMFKHIRIARFASRTLDHELEKNTRSVIPYFTSTFVIMALFSVVTCMMTDWVRSKPWLGLLGNISATLATVSAFGCCIYFGVDFIGINLAAPFLMIGIGIDDTFVMLAAWRRTNMKDSVPERMAHMLSEAAVSITITSVTDMVSFWIGVFSPFPSVTIFCTYSGAATLFTFIWHLTFFSGCVAISGYCEKKNLHSVFCFKVQPKSKSVNRSWFYRAFCSGGVDPNDEHNPIDNQEHGFMVFFRDYFASFINNSFVKVLVIAIFAVYLLGAGYGITQIEEGLERRKVAKKDSYAVEFFDREDDYFREFPYRVQVIVSGEMDYSNKTVQEQVEFLTQTFENTSYVSSTLYTESWLRSFVQYADRNQDYLNITTDNEQEFIKSLKEYWLTPTSPFSLDVAFNDEGTKIKGMRFLIQAVNISGTEHEKEMVRALRKICHDSPLNASVFHPYFVFFDQFELVRPISLQNMVLGALVMMVISFLFIPNPLCSLWVAFSIISIETGVIGYMALWKVNLDSISMINLIMCIGFSVDFTAHICYAYMSSTSKHPDDKVRDCLYAVGLPIFQGAVSTILGMVALLLADSYIFSVFFKMVFLVVFCGAMHGLFLLPVLLSVFGPGSCSKNTKKHEISMANIDKTLPTPYYIPHPQFTLKNNEPAAIQAPSKFSYGDFEPTGAVGQRFGKSFEAEHFAPLETSSFDGIRKISNPKQDFDKEKRFIQVDNNKPGKRVKNYDIERDLGLGTSEENSSESSSNNSANISGANKTIDLDEDVGFRNPSVKDYSSSQFYASQVLDIYGNSSEEEWYRQRVENNKRRFYESRAQADNRERFLREQNKHRRRYSPPEQIYHGPRPQNLNRSSSYHNLQHAKYVQGMRFP